MAAVSLFKNTNMPSWRHVPEPSCMEKTTVHLKNMWIKQLFSSEVIRFEILLRVFGCENLVETGSDPRMDNLFKIYIYWTRSLRMHSTETAYIWKFSELWADRIILNCKFYYYRWPRQLFCFLSNLNVIVSEFYDLDVGTVKTIEIKPRRVRSSFFGSDGEWILNQVQRCNLRLVFIIYFHSIHDVYYLHYIEFNVLLNHKLLFCFHTFTTSEYLKDHIWTVEKDMKPWLIMAQPLMYKS